MSADSDQSRLPVPANGSGAGDTTYRCPGEELPITEAVHLGRVASGWSGCSDCVWRQHANGQRGFASVRPEWSSRATRTQIRRTEFGVRGAYLNAIDRFRGAQLASIFSTHLTNIHQQVARQRQTTDGPGRFQRIDVESGITIAVGYDGCHGSADVFSGVVSAVMQNGCHVIDAGRCTAASLQHVCRRYPQLSGSVLVTGSGGEFGDIGLDVFDTHGQAVAIPWQKFGVSVRLPDRNRTVVSAIPADEHSVVSPSQAVQETLQRLRIDSLPDDNVATDASGAAPQAILQLPSIQDSAGHIFRSNRRSGSVSSVMSERFYEDWLLRWWPVHSRQQARFFVRDEQAIRRLEWLTSRCTLNVEIHCGTDSSMTTFGSATEDAGVSFFLEDDDRFLGITSRRGRRLSVVEVADWVNRWMPATSGHLTAHAAPDGRRVLLVDVAAPNTGCSQQVISDGLALAGWVLTSMENGKNPLPV
ncbi:MAG: hypothetical protein R3C59_00320 [Planctomycetaceae bacterium]